ncbi:MAG TPA: outer membrane beta-barrel protein [Burkholderiales bacterium]|nr:outer membrane beta-barrel protein [Burkholderiales bacterium]
MNRSFLIVLLAGIALPAIGQAPGETERVWQPNAFVLTIKTGDLRLADDSQTISGNDRIFERSASTVFAIEGETRLQREAENVSFGGEILQYRNPFRRASTASGSFEDTMYTHAFLAKAKYYFRPGKALQPYLGGGIGTVWSHDFEGPIHGFANGIGYQGVLGMQLRSDRIGMRVEYMYLRGRLTDNNGEKIDASTYGLFAGLSFFFGRR